VSRDSEWLEFFGEGEVDWGAGEEPEIEPDEDGYYPDPLEPGEIEATSEYDPKAYEWGWEYSEPWDEFTPEQLEEWTPDWDDADYGKDNDWYAGLDDEWDY